MDVREKLVELFYDNNVRCDQKIEGLADDVMDIIANGVMVQKWISVDDRLPEFPGHYLVCTSINYWHGGCMDINENHKYHQNGTPVGYDGSTMSVLDCYYDVTGHWNRVCDRHVTHWMQLPPPPKGE